MFGTFASVNDLYSSRLSDALSFASEQFKQKTRKGSNTPYLLHLLQVATWVGDYGGSEEQIIAALLHDYLEDIEGAQMEIVTQRFGSHVATMIEMLSDSAAQTPKPRWRPRKERYIQRLRYASAEIKLIACCDKLHNALSIVQDFQEVGELIWSRFSADKADTLWYYEEVTKALGHQWRHVALERLSNAVEQLRHIAKK